MRSEISDTKALKQESAKLIHKSRWHLPKRPGFNPWLPNVFLSSSIVLLCLEFQIYPIPTNYKTDGRLTQCSQREQSSYYFYLSRFLKKNKTPQLILRKRLNLILDKICKNYSSFLRSSLRVLSYHIIKTLCFCLFTIKKSIKYRA